jgi:hypothetical protein
MFIHLNELIVTQGSLNCQAFQPTVDLSIEPASNRAPAMVNWYKVQKMLTKTVRSRFSHEIGEKVEGCTILQKRVVIPPVPAERRLGVYDYEVEVPPAVEKPRTSKGAARAAVASSRPATADSFTRTTPEDMGAVIRRIPSR